MSVRATDSGLRKKLDVVSYAWR